MSERERAEQVVRVWIQQEAQRCAASNGRIDPAYLTGLWRRGDELITVLDQHGEILTQAAVDRLLSALPVEGDTPQVCQWREIATAPKDADLILLYQAGEGVRAGYWDTITDPDRPHWFSPESQLITGGQVQPTHWMPLPERPKVSHE